MTDSSLKEIRVRYITALVVAVLSNATFLICLYSILNLNIYFPFLSLEGLWSLLVLCLNTFLFILAINNVYNQFKASDVAFERNNALLQILFSQQSLKFSVNMLLIGMFEALTVSYFLGFRDSYVWILEYGAFLGFSFVVFVISENFLTLTYENKAISHIVFIRDAIIQNSVRTIGRIIYFILFYAAFHVVILQDFQFSFLAGLNLTVLIELYLVGLFIFATWFSALLIVETSLTANLSPIVNDKSHLVAVGEFLSSKGSNGLIYHLTFNRLAETVAKESKTRDQIFNITNLNGKVAVWEELSTRCISTLKSFAEGVNKTNKEMSAHSPSIYPPPRPFNSYLTEDKHFSKVCSEHLNLSSILYNALNKVTLSLSHLPIVNLVMREVPYASTWKLFSSGGTNKVASVWATDDSSHQTGQAVIWSTEVLGILVLSSYVEDRLGAVQQSLGQIFTVIDETVESVETHFKLVGLMPPNGGLLSSKMNKYHPAAAEDVTTHDEGAPISVQTYRYASDANLPWRIHTTLRWALLSCLKRFGQHLKTLQIDAKRRAKLERLMENLDIRNGTE